MNIKDEIKKSIKQIKGNKPAENKIKKPCTEGSFISRLSDYYRDKKNQQIQKYNDKLNKEQKEFEEYLRSQTEGNNSLSVWKYMEYKRKLNKQKQKSLLYKITTLTPIDFTIMRPIVLPDKQKVIEDWWKSIDNNEAYRLLESNVITIPKLARIIIEKEREVPRGLSFYVLNYWLLLLFVSIMILLSTCLMLHLNLAFFVFDFLVMLYVLWLCKMYECKVYLGLVFFCPFTISTLRRLHTYCTLHDSTDD